MQVVISLLKLLEIQAEQVKKTGKETASDFYVMCYTMEAFESTFPFNFNSVYMLEVVRCVTINRKKKERWNYKFYMYIFCSMSKYLQFSSSRGVCSPPGGTEALKEIHPFLGFWNSQRNILECATEYFFIDIEEAPDCSNIVLFQRF